MGTLERRSREKQDLRQRILDAARGLFARDGYDAVSMRRIAEAVEYTPAAIYLHFADKQSLIHELCRQDFGTFSAGFAQAARVDDPVERIRWAGREYVRFAVQNPNHFRVMFMTPIPPTIGTDTENLQRRGDPDQDGYAFLHHAVAEAATQHRFREDLVDVDLLTQTLWAGVHGVAALEVTMHNDPWFQWTALQARVGLMIDALLRGMLRENPAGGPA